jgi:hypothetical protein
MIRYGNPDSELMYHFYKTKTFHGIQEAENMSKVRITIARAIADAEGVRTRLAAEIPPVPQPAVTLTRLGWQALPTADNPITRTTTLKGVI